MGGTAPANQLRLSFTGSQDGEAETETCRAAKLLVANDDSNLRPVRAQLAEYLRTNAPDALVADMQWNDYQLLFFLNSRNRYIIGIEPTFTYLEDPRKYWLWLHLSEDEPATCDREYCGASGRTDVVSALGQDLGAQYVLTDHGANPRLESTLRQKTNVTEVYRDAAFSLYRIGS